VTRESITRAPERAASQDPCNVLSKFGGHPSVSAPVHSAGDRQNDSRVPAGDPRLRALASRRQLQLSQRAPRVAYSACQARRRVMLSHPIALIVHQIGFRSSQLAPPLQAEPIAAYERDALRVRSHDGRLARPRGASRPHSLFCLRTPRASAALRPGHWHASVLRYPH